MGLDWIAGNKPKPGHEDELRQLLQQGREEGISDEMRQRYAEISIAPYTTVGAPVVGQDRIADAFILYRLRNRDLDDEAEPPPVDLESEQAHTPQSDEERELLLQMKGYHVLELAPACDGLPVYTHGAWMEGLDLTSFRGKFLHDCEQIIGEALIEQAYEDQNPEQLDAFGKQLIEHARRYASEHGCPGIEQRREPPDELDSAEGRAHVLFAAGRWCCYWGSRGFSLDAWS